MSRNPVLFVAGDDSAPVESVCAPLCEDFEPHGFTSSRPVIEIPQILKPHFLLVDERMPQLSGAELLFKLRRIHPDTSGIIFTAYTGIETAARIMKAGAIDFLTKPVHPGASAVSFCEQVSRKDATRKRR